MKRILINATHNEEIRVALCKDNHLYDFDLENRTREQKKSNIYKGHVTRVEPSLEAVFVEYGSERQGFLPVREIASEYLNGNPREDNIRKLIKEGDELIVQIEKEERGNKGAALSTFISLAGRYLVLMPNNPRGGGISRQITGKLREEMKRMLANMDLPKGMSVIVRTAGIGKTQEDLQHDLNHLLNIWSAIQEQNQKYPSPRLVHQEAGVVTRAVRDYLRDDISEIWIDSENAYNEAENFIKAVMPKQIGKLRKYTDFEPMFASFNVEKQIETAYQREVRLPSGGSIVIDQTEALVSIDINSAKSTKGSDVSETAYHTNLEAAEEIARQLRLRDMGGLVVIDFIDMNDSKHQRDVEKRLLDSTKYDRARVQFGTISKFGLMEMSRQRLRPSLEESTGYICPRCHGNGMIRDLRSLSLSIMRQIEEIALKRRHGEVQAEVPTDIAAFLLNEKRESLVYLEQDSGTRITILPHAHMESPHFKLHFNQDGFVPASYERISDTQDTETSELGYAVDWQTNDAERPEQQPIRQPANKNKINNKTSATTANKAQVSAPQSPADSEASSSVTAADNTVQPAAVAWLSNLFAPTAQARTSDSISSQEAANAIEEIVNSGGQSRGAFGDIAAVSTAPQTSTTSESQDNQSEQQTTEKDDDKSKRRSSHNNGNNRNSDRNERNKDDKRKRKGRPHKSNRGRSQDKRKSDTSSTHKTADDTQHGADTDNSNELSKRRPHSKRDSRGSVERGEALTKSDKSTNGKNGQHHKHDTKPNNDNDKEVTLHVKEAPNHAKEREVVHFSLDGSSKAKNSDKTENKQSSDANNVKSNKANDDNANDNNANNNSSKGGDVNSNVDKSADKTTDKATTKTSASVESKPAESKPVESKKAADDIKDAKSKETETSATQIDSSKQKTDDAAQAPSVESKGDSDHDANNADKATSEDKTLSFDTQALFAERYVTAKKYGQASNDPRVVRANQAANDDATPDAKLSDSNTETEVSSADSANNDTATKAVISGTVGEFVRNTLGDNDEQLQSGNVIASFLQALSKFESQRVTPSDASKDSNVTVDADHDDNTNLQSFDFSNYGYAPLSTSYLDDFQAMTSAVNAYSTTQGKAEPVALTVGQRASNDPRGQHPDYQSKTDSNVGDIAASDNGEDSGNIIDSNSADKETSADEAVVTDAMEAVDSPQQDVKSNAQDASDKVEDIVDENELATEPQNDYTAFSELMAGSVGRFVEQILGETGKEMLHQGNTETAFLTALKQPMAQILERLQDSAGQDKRHASQSSINETAHALASTDDVNHVADDAMAELHEEHLAKSKSSDNSEAKVDDNLDDEASDKSASAKTSIASYKSMIETISEQLSSQMGLSTLMPISSKPAATKSSSKPRTRKAKADDSSPDKND